MTSMNSMFRGATGLNPSLKGWDFSGITASAGLENAFKGVNFSLTSYSTLLIELDATLPDEVTSTLSFPSAMYHAGATAPRAALVSDGWAITDGGESTAFISRWQTTTADETITLPLRGDFSYNFNVDWGDGSTSEITSHDDSDRIHTYTTAGTYTVSITGTVSAWFFNNTGDKDKILEVLNLGDVGWINFQSAFRGCSNLTTFNGGKVSSVVSMTSMFARAENVVPEVGHWDTSSVQSMASMFYLARSADPDVSNWDTSNVQSMGSMFYHLDSGSPDVSNWNTSSVTNMSGMFQNAGKSNPDVSNWDFSSVTSSLNVAFFGVNFSADTYSSALISLDATLSDSVTGRLLFKSIPYNSNAATARANLVSDGWTITDAGQR